MEGVGIATNHLLVYISIIKSIEKTTERHMRISKQEVQKYRSIYSNLRTDKQKLDYIISLYSKGFKIRRLTTIFGETTDYYVKLLEYYNIKLCGNKNCPNGRLQNRSNFGVDKSQPDGLKNNCKTCANNVSSNYYTNNTEKRLEYCQKYRDEHKGEKREYFKEYDQQPAKFDTYDSKISYIDITRRDPENSELLQVRCTYCGEFFNPTNLEVRSRTGALDGRRSDDAENRLYCSQHCKDECPIYGQVKYSKDDPNSWRNNRGISSREVQAELRQMVFERDNYTCQICGKHQSELTVGLHCHHFEGIEINPIESADADICITLCKICHKQVHKLPGCSYYDFRRKECET